MEGGINMLGRLILVKNGVLKPDKATTLEEGENKIGKGVDCILRLKSTTLSLLDIHCVVRVSKNGAALCINKSKGDPIRINDKLALRAQFLKHGDTLLIIDKEFRYLNEHVKDKPEDFFVKEKPGLIPIRKSVNPLTKTPARSIATATPQRNLNLSLRAIQTKPSSTPKLNQTLHKRVARTKSITKTPNYRTLNRDIVQKKLLPKTPSLVNDCEQDLIAFSPLAQPLTHSPLSIVDEDAVEILDSSPEPQLKETGNEPSSTSLGQNLHPSESPNKTTSQSKQEESDNSDVGDEDVDQSRSDIFEESDKVVEEQRNFITVRPRRLVQEAKTNDKPQIMDNFEKKNASRSSSYVSNIDRTLSSLKAFFTMDSSVNENDTSVMEQVEKTMTTLKESESESEYDNNEVDDEEKSMTTNRGVSEVSFYENNEDDVIPETQQANDDSVFLDQNDEIENVGNKARTSTVSSGSFNSVYQDTNQSLSKSLVEEMGKDEVSESLRIPSTRLRQSTRKSRSLRGLPSGNELIQEAHNLPGSSKMNSSEYVSESTLDAANRLGDTPQNKSSQESTQDPGEILELRETSLNKSLTPIIAQVVNISASESRHSIQNKSSKCVSTFDESTHEAVNESVKESRVAIQKRSSKRFSTFNDSTRGAKHISASASKDTIQNKSSKLVSTFVESTTEAGNISELMETTLNKSLKPITAQVVNISASESRDTIQNKSSKGVSTFDESTQDAVNKSRDAIQKRSSKRFSTLDDSTENAENISASQSKDTIQNKSSKPVSTYVESTTYAGINSELMETTLNKSLKPITTQVENISASKTKDISQNSTFDESTQDDVNISALESKHTIQSKSSEPVSTFDESTQDAVKIPASESRDTTRNKSSKRISTFDESTQDAVDATPNKTGKRMSTFDESTQVVHSLNQSSLSRGLTKNTPKRSTTFDESTQDAINTSAPGATTLNKSPKRVSTFDESTQDTVNVSAAERKPKRMSTFDEPIQVVDKSKYDTQAEESTKDVLQHVSDKNPTGILDDTEFLSPVRPLRKSIRVQSSVTDISTNSALHGSTMSHTVKCQLSNSSMTDTSLTPSTTSAKSVSSQSFSSFKHNKPETPKAGILEETAIIDVVNITDAGLVQNPDVAGAIDASSASISKSRASLAERRFSNRTAQMFVDVTCTSTPFQKQSTARQSNIEENSPGVCQTNTLRASKVNERRRSSRISVSKKVEDNCLSCKSITNRSQSLDSSKNVTSKRTRSRSNSVTEPKTTPNTVKMLTPLKISKNVSATRKRSMISHLKNVEDSNASLFRTPTSQRKSRIEEKLAITDDETPKSHLTTSRRLSKSTYNPEVEDITPVTPERLCVSGFSDDSKIPSKTPVLSDKVNVERQSTGTITKDVETSKSDLTSKNNNKPQREMRRQRSPLNRLSVFEGVKKLMKTPPNSPKNDLRNIPNLRKIFSPKQEKSPINDLTNPVGVKNLLKTPMQQIDDLLDAESDISGVAELNVSNVEVLRQGSDIENSEDLFTQLTGQQPIRSYRKCNSLSVSKAEIDLNSRKTMGDLPNISPSVQKWVEQTSAVKMEEVDDVLADEPTPKSRSDQSLSAKKATPETSKSQNYDVGDLDDWNKDQTAESVEFTDEALSIASSNGEASNASYDAVFDDSTDEEVSLQNKSLNLKKSDVKEPNPQESDKSSLEYSDNELDAQNSDDQLSPKLEVSIDEVNLSGSDHDVKSEKSENDHDASLFNKMSKRPVRKYKTGRSLSPRKVAPPQQNKSRKSVFNFPNTTTAVPDVEAWKRERVEQTNIEKPETPLKGAKTETGLVTDKVRDDYDSNLLNNMSKLPVRKSKSGRSLSPKKSSPQQIKVRKSEFNFSATAAIPDVETWKREQNEQTNRGEPKNPLKGTKRKSSLISQEVLPEKKRYKVAFDLPDEESSLEVDEKKKVTRSGRVIKQTSKAVDVKKLKGKKGKAAQAAKEVSEKIDNENNRAEDSLRSEEHQEEGGSASGQTGTKINTRNRKKNTMDIDDNIAEVNPVKKRGRNENEVKASEPTKDELENGQEAVVDIPPPKRRRQNTRKATVVSLESEENEIKESPPKSRTRRAKAATQTTTDADSVSTSTPKQTGRKAKNATEAAVTDSASASTPKPTRSRAKNAPEVTVVTDSASTSSPKPRGLSVKLVELTDTKNTSPATIKAASSTRANRQNKNIKQPIDSPAKKRGRKAEAETVNEQETIAASPPKTRKRNAKVPVETPQENENKQITTKPRGRTAKKVAEETPDIETSTSSTSKPNLEEIDNKKALPKPRGRRAKNVAEETPDVETSTSSTVKTRGRKPKNVAEETAVVESSTSSTPKPNQEEMDNKRAPQKPRGRRAKNVAEEKAVIESSLSSTPKPSQEEVDNKQDLPKPRGGRKAKNIAVETAEVETSKTSTPKQEEMNNKRAAPKPRGRRAKNVAEESAEVEASASSTSKTNQEEMNNKHAPPKPRGRRAKNVVEETADVETATSSTPNPHQEEIVNKLAPPKPRGRRAKNVPEETADFESATSSTPKPNQEEIENKQALPKPKGRRAKNVAEESADVESSTSSTPKKRGRKAKNVTESINDIEPAPTSIPNKKGLSTRAAAKAQEDKNEVIATPPKKRTRR